MPMPSKYEKSAASGGVIGIAAGCDHSLVLKQDRSVWTTGSNNFGQLGHTYYQAFRHTYHQVISSGVQVVAAGDWHSMALGVDGSLWATGANLYGQLGEGTVVDKNSFRKPSPTKIGGAFYLPW